MTDKSLREKELSAINRSIIPGNYVRLFSTLLPNSHDFLEVEQSIKFDVWTFFTEI